MHATLYRAMLMGHCKSVAGTSGLLVLTIEKVRREQKTATVHDHPQTRVVKVTEWSTPGGATQSGKGYQLRSDLLGDVAVVSQNGYKKGGCPVIISSKRGAVIVLIANIVDRKNNYICSDYS